MLGISIIQQNAFGFGPRSFPPPRRHACPPRRWEALRVAHGSSQIAGVLAKPMEKATSLIRFAASRAFYDIPKSPLQQLARHLGCVFQVTDDLLTRVNKLVTHVLGLAF